MVRFLLCCDLTLEIFAVFETIPTILFPVSVTPRHLLMQILQSLNPFDLERLEDENIRAVTGKFANFRARAIVSCLRSFLSQFLQVELAPGWSF